MIFSITDLKLGETSYYKSLRKTHNWEGGREKKIGEEVNEKMKRVWGGGILSYRLELGGGKGFSFLIF